MESQALSARYGTECQSRYLFRAFLMDSLFMFGILLNGDKNIVN